MRVCERERKAVESVRERKRVREKVGESERELVSE